MLLCLSPTVLNPRTLPKASVFLGKCLSDFSSFLLFSPSHPRNCIFVYNYYSCLLSSSLVKILTCILSPFMENILSTVKSSQCFSSNSPFQLENNGIKTSHAAIRQGTTHYFLSFNGLISTRTVIRDLPNSYHHSYTTGHICLLYKCFFQRSFSKKKTSVCNISQIQLPIHSQNVFLN